MKETEILNTGSVKSTIDVLGNKTRLERKIAILETQGLYNICFRNAGVGCMFHEDERARKEMKDRWLGRDPDFGPSNSRDDAMAALKRSGEYQRIRLKAGLVVYKYYPTLAKAVDGELVRLFGKEEAKDLVAALG
jgi:hypothetical protein